MGGSDGGARAPAGAARDVICVPRVTRRRRDDAVSESVRVDFADGDGARGAQAGDGSCVFRWDVAREDIRGAGGLDTCAIDDVLDAEGDAVERAEASSSGTARVGGVRLFESPFRTKPQPGLNPIVGTRNAAEGLRDDFARGEIAAVEPGRDRGDGRRDHGAFAPRSPLRGPRRRAARASQRPAPDAADASRSPAGRRRRPGGKSRLPRAGRRSGGRRADRWRRSRLER